MFECCISSKRPGVRTEWRAGLGLGVLVYAAAGGLALLLSMPGERAAHASVPPELIFHPPRPVAENQRATRPTPQTPRRPPPRKHVGAIVAPPEHPPPLEAPPEPPGETTESGAPAEEASGVSHGGVEGSEGEANTRPGLEEDVLTPTGAMTLPKLLSGESIRYSREALEAGVEGKIIARCVITREGRVRNCRALKGVELMTERVLAALETRSYSPALLDGRAVNVAYVIEVTLRIR